jgi:hypothetical protein
MRTSERILTGRASSVLARAAAAALVVAGVLLALSAEASAAIVVAISAPSANQTVSTPTLAVSTQVTSSLALQSVQAQIASVSQSLTFDGTCPGANCWNGSMDLSSLSPGNLTLTVTGTDVNGGTGSAQVTFVYDPPPLVKITSPPAWAVARPQMQVSATCSTCVTLTVAYQGNSIATGVTSVNQMADLSAYDLSTGLLTIVGTDAKSASTIVNVPIEVESSSDLTEALAVSGFILDADCGRALVLDPDQQTLKMYNRAAQTYTTIATVTGNVSATGIPYAFANLTTTGAAFQGSTLYGLYEWNGSTATRIDATGSQGASVAGPYILWGTGSLGSTLLLRDTSQETTTTIQLPVIGDPQTVDSYVVAANGDAFIVGDESLNYRIHRWHAGTLDVVAGPSSVVWELHTDGQNLVYAVGDTFSLLQPDGGTSTVVTSSSFSPTANASIVGISGGLVSYLVLFGGSTQLFEYGPAGATTRLTSYGTGYNAWSIDGMDPLGGVIFEAAGPSGPIERYFASPSASPVHVSGMNGTYRWIDGAWYLSLGRSLFHVPTGEDAGAPSSCTSGGDGGAAVDAGGADAGPSADASASSDGSEADAATTADATTDGGGASSSGAHGGNSSGSGGVGASSGSGGGGGSNSGGGSGGGGGCDVSEAGAPVWGAAWVVVVAGLLAGRRRSGSSRHPSAGAA